jgi:hypothetical protein
VQRILAIARLTWKSAFRYRLFWALLGLLLIAVVALPLLLKHDKTARGFVQILLTYNLSVITALLGVSTLWIACGSLARDIEEGSMQTLAVKPVARWQIWLGKWLGIVLLNAALLTLAGGSVYLLLQARARQLPEAQQRILREEIFVARAALSEPPPDIEKLVDQAFRERMEKNPVPAADQNALRDQLRELVKAGVQVVPPGYVRPWRIPLGARAPLLRNRPLFIRARFNAAQTNLAGTYVGLWQVGAPPSQNVWQSLQSMAPAAYHEFAIPPNLFAADGTLTVIFHNRSESTLLFPVEDGFEILYREGGFGLNYARGLAVILCWLGLLAALGLTCASFLSFPVAAFVSASLLVVALSSNSLSRVVHEGVVIGLGESGRETASRVLDVVMVPVFKGMLQVVDLVQGTSPVDALSTGRSVTWEQLLGTFAKTVVLLGGLLAAFGIWTFSRRELGTAQTQG